MSVLPPFFINILPPNDQRDLADYRLAVQNSLRASEVCEFRHTLVTVGAQRQEPWAVAQFAMERSKAFSPLIAVNPAYSHPVTVAKRLVSLAQLYPNRLALNLVSGSFASEMAAISDVDFQSRNERLVEFYTALRALLSPEGRVTLSGRYFSFHGVDIFPKQRQGAVDFFLSGSFGFRLSAGAGVYFVKNMRPLEETRAADHPGSGLGVGICARASAAGAVAALEEFFPVTRQGELMFSLSLANSQTPWNVWLRDHLARNAEPRLDYHLGPLKTFRSSAPFLVGSYESVAAQLGRYASLGYCFFLCDYADGDQPHVAEVLARVRSGVLRGGK